MKTAARSAPAAAGTASEGRAAGAVVLLEGLPVTDPRVQPGVVAWVQSEKEEPLLVATPGVRPVGSLKMADSDRPGPRAEGFEAKERVPGWPGPGDHLEERWASKQVVRLFE